MKMDVSLLAPCGLYCGTCKFFKREEKPNCSGCVNQNGHPFWGECRLFACAREQGVEHCGDCKQFLCDLFVKQFDPAHGQKSVFTRAGLLVYRKKAGTEKFVEMIEKLDSEEDNQH